MVNSKYAVRYLPVFVRDLDNAVDYIQYQLNNPTAAADFIDEVEAAIQKRSMCPKAFEPYRSAKERRYPYYRIYVKNYIIFYIVIDDIMEVHRLLYHSRNVRRNI